MSAECGPLLDHLKDVLDFLQQAYHETSRRAAEADKVLLDQKEAAQFLDLRRKPKEASSSADVQAQTIPSGPSIDKGNSEETSTTNSRIRTSKAAPAPISKSQGPASSRRPVSAASKAQPSSRLAPVPQRDTTATPGSRGAQPAVAAASQAAGPSTLSVASAPSVPSMPLQYRRAREAVEELQRELFIGSGTHGRGGLKAQAQQAAITFEEKVRSCYGSSPADDAGDSSGLPATKEQQRIAALAAAHLWLIQAVSEVQQGGSSPVASPQAILALLQEVQEETDALLQQQPPAAPGPAGSSGRSQGHTDGSKQDELMLMSWRNRFLRAALEPWAAAEAAPEQTPAAKRGPHNLWLPEACWRAAAASGMQLPDDCPSSILSPAGADVQPAVLTYNSQQQLVSYCRAQQHVQRCLFQHYMESQLVAPLIPDGPPPSDPRGLERHLALCRLSQALMAQPQHGAMLSTTDIDETED